MVVWVLRWDREVNILMGCLGVEMYISLGVWLEDGWELFICC